MHSSSNDVTAVFVLLVALCLVPTSASAVQLYEDEDNELTLDANLFVGVVGGAEMRTDQADDYGLDLSLARVKLAAEYSDLALVGIQVGGASGNVELFDALAALRPTDWLSVRMGRYKMPISEEYLISATDLPFVGRTLLNALVPGRAIGIEPIGTFEAGDAEIEGRVGLFQPSKTSFTEPQGQLVSGRIKVTLESGVDFHAGYAQHVFTDNQLPGGEQPASTCGQTVRAGARSVNSDRVFECNQPLDVAVGFEDDQWNLHLEGVTVLDAPEGDTAYGGYAHAQYRFGDEKELQFEPGVGYDVLFGESDFHRGTVGFNTFWWGTGFETLLNYRLLHNATAAAQTHSIFLNLRGKL